MSKWKTVDNPPEDQTNVLIVWDTMYTIWWYQPGSQVWYRFDNQWFSQTKKVTHWRELPKLPK